MLSAGPGAAALPGPELCGRSGDPGVWTTGSVGSVWVPGSRSTALVWLVRTLPRVSSVNAASAWPGVPATWHLLPPALVAVLPGGAARGLLEVMAGLETECCGLKDQAGISYL